MLRSRTSTSEKSRILTYEQLRKAGACARGLRIFKQTWGAQTFVNQRWAIEALNAGYTSWDMTWAIVKLCPSWAPDVYFHVRDSYLISRNFGKWERISAAAFAAIYVECE